MSLSDDRNNYNDRNKMQRKSPERVLVIYLGAFDAARSEFLLVATGTVDVLLTRDKRFSADRRLAHEAAKALFMPLPALVFHFLGSYTLK